MPAAAYGTLLATAITVAALALYLIRVAMHLRHVVNTLGTIIAGLRAIVNQTEPLQPVMGEIVREIEAARRSIEGVLERKAAEEPPPEPPRRRRKKAAKKTTARR